MHPQPDPHSKELTLSQPELEALLSLTGPHRGRSAAAALGVEHVEAGAVSPLTLATLAGRGLIDTADGWVRTCDPATVILHALVCGHGYLDWGCEGGPRNSFTKAFYSDRICAVVTLSSDWRRVISATPPGAARSYFLDAWLGDYETTVTPGTDLHTWVSWVTAAGTSMLNCVRTQGAWSAARSIDGSPLTLDPSLTSREAILRAVDAL